MFGKSDESGNGTVTDLILLNKSGSFIMKTPTGTVNAEFGGTVAVTSLAGTGTRNVVVDANGLMSAP